MILMQNVRLLHLIKYWSPRFASIKRRRHGVITVKNLRPLTNEARYRDAFFGVTFMKIFKFRMFQVKGLPNILTINTGLDNERDLEYLKNLTGHAAATATIELNGRTGDGGVENASPTSRRTNGFAKQCRYGSGCSRLDCHFAHPERYEKLIFGAIFNGFLNSKVIKGNISIIFLFFLKEIFDKY